MKRLVIATAITLSSSLAFAAPHGYQAQVGSSELDPSIWEGPELASREVEPSHFTPSLTALYESVDIDGSLPFRFVGTITPSGPTRISLYEVYRGSPEGTANDGYYARFPADTDWDRVAGSRKADPDNV